MSAEKKPGLIERGLRWDTSFNRRLGAASTVAAFAAAAINAPVAATYLALFAGGNFAVVEMEKRYADDITKKRIGNTAYSMAAHQREFALAA